MFATSGSGSRFLVRDEAAGVSASRSSTFLPATTMSNASALSRCSPPLSCSPSTTGVAGARPASQLSPRMIIPTPIQGAKEPPHSLRSEGVLASVSKDPGLALSRSPSAICHQADASEPTSLRSITTSSSACQSSSLGQSLDREQGITCASGRTNIKSRPREGSPSILVTLSVHEDDREPLHSNGRSRYQGERDTKPGLCNYAGVKPALNKALSSSSLSINTHDRRTSLSQSSGSSLHTLAEPRSSITLLTPTSQSYQGSGMNASRSYGPRSSTMSEGSVSPTLSDRLRVPSSDRRRHSDFIYHQDTRRKSQSQAPASTASWLAGNTYCVTPPFTRLGLNAPDVVLPLTVKQYQRQQRFKLETCGTTGVPTDFVPPSRQSDEPRSMNARQDSELEGYATRPVRLSPVMDVFNTEAVGPPERFAGEETPEVLEHLLAAHEEEQRDVPSNHRNEAEMLSLPICKKCSHGFGLFCTCHGSLAGLFCRRAGKKGPVTSEEKQEAVAKPKEAEGTRTTKVTFMKFVSKLSRGGSAVA